MNCFIGLIMFFSSWVCYSQQLLDAQLSACEKGGFPEFLKSRISKRLVSGDTLVLTIGFSANCCIDPGPKIELKNDTLFINKGNRSHDHCACDCCFELELTILEVRDTNFVVYVDGRLFEYSSHPYIKLPDDYRFDDTSMHNRRGENNLKIGLWRTYYPETNTLIFEEYYSEESLSQEQKWYKKYDETGKLIEVGIQSAEGFTMNVFEPDAYFRLLERLN